MKRLRAKQGKNVSVLLAVAIVVSAGLSFCAHRYLFAPQNSPEGTGHVPVDATVTSVLPSGRGIKRETLLTVRYEYGGRGYSSTVRLGGYTEGRYMKGDVIKRRLDPAHPETLFQ